MPAKYASEMDVLRPEVWGPHYWFFLMTIALSYPLVPNEVTKKKYYEFIQNFPLFIPNEEIAKDFDAMLNMYPVTPYLDGRESFILWVIFIHNKINAKLEKKELSRENALENYLAEYRPKPVYIMEHIKWSRHVIYLLILFAFLAIIYMYY